MALPLGINRLCSGSLGEGLYTPTMAAQDQTMMMAQLTSDVVLDEAFEWLCIRRKEYPDRADVWDFRRNWAPEKARLRADLLSGDYRFGLLTRIDTADGEVIDLWAARDAVVLKALTIVLAGVLPLSRRCTHVKGHGGAKAAVRQVRDHLAGNRFVLRTDVKSFYASIDHVLLMDRLADHIGDRRILCLLGQYMKRTSERGGWFWDHERGISLGCPLSPLMGAFFLAELDERFAHCGLFYVRFMDDILVLAPTRWKLRRAVQAVNEVLGNLRLEKHPDKTFIGRIEKGFDFLGFHFSRDGLRVAETSMRKFVERAARLYEQDRKEPSGSPRLGAYVRRWLGWAKVPMNCGAGIGGFRKGVPKMMNSHRAKRRR
jgi:hypothetical protein